jgi:YggT family protein
LAMAPLLQSTEGWVAPTKRKNSGGGGVNLLPHFSFAVQQQQKSCEMWTQNLMSQVMRELEILQAKVDDWVKKTVDSNGFLQGISQRVALVHAQRRMATTSAERFPLRRRNFAAIIPGDSVAETVVASSIFNFLNIYNTLLITRLILTWFPSAPEVIANPLSTICDPYLNVFRGIIPPLGSLDLSPILAFLVLNVFTNTASALPAELNAGPSRKLTWRQQVQKRKGQTAVKKVEP